MPLKIRLSPTQSATLYKLGAKKKGNDGNIWTVIETKNGIKRWRLYRKPTKNTKTNTVSKGKKTKTISKGKKINTVSKGKKTKTISKDKKAKSYGWTTIYMPHGKIKLYDMPFESISWEDPLNNINMRKGKDILDVVSMRQINAAMKKLTNENNIEYYRKNNKHDTDEIIKNIRKSKLIFNAYEQSNGIPCAEIFIVPPKGFMIPDEVVNNLQKWISGGISDGFGENGHVIGKYNLFMAYK